MLFLIFMISWSFSLEVASIGGVSFSDKDFFSRYGQKEWLNSDPKQKNRLLNDFIKREACAMQAKRLGFLYDPDVRIKLRDRGNMLLVNSVYEELVAKPLVSSNDLLLAKKNIIKEVHLSHILIGYNNSKLQNPPERSKDEAFLLAQNIKGNLSNGSSFSSLAKKHSDDPSVVKNQGDLGWIGWGRTVGGFQDVAFAQPFGYPSDPVLTDFGYHIILTHDSRPSKNAQDSPEEIEAAAYNASRGSISHLLRDEATRFDAANLKQANVIYNDVELNKIVDLVSEQQASNKIKGQHKINLVSLFQNTEDIGVVCVYNKQGFGIKWFAEKLKGTPASRHPQIQSKTSLKEAFDIILLQDIAIKLGIKQDVVSTYHYLNQLTSMQNSFLYDAYLKWLVNGAPKPDSSSVKLYYDTHKNQKYKEKPKVVVRDLRVGDRSLADSLLVAIKGGLGFVEAATSFSQTNPSKGGLMKPFEEGKYNELGSLAHSMPVGDVSGVISNLDKTFSIIMVEERLPERITALKRVYTRIESLLLRENQNQAKKDGVWGLFDELNIKTNDAFFKVDPLNVD